VFIVHAYQTSQYVVPRGDILLGKWRSSFAENSDGKMNVQSACALNTRYMDITSSKKNSITSSDNSELAHFFLPNKWPTMAKRTMNRTNWQNKGREENCILMECTYLMHPFFAILHALWP
jgi:hypothetical protein